MATGEIPGFRFESSALVGLDAEVREVVGREAIGEPFHFSIEVRVPSIEGLDPEALLAESATLVFLRGARELRRVHGMVLSATDESAPGAGHGTLRVELVPRVAALAENRRLEVYVDGTIDELVRMRLLRAGFEEGKDFELRLGSTYPRREFVVQYEESDLDFLRRLLEDLGISFFFDHRDERDVLVLTDDREGFRDDSETPLAYRAREEGHGVSHVSSSMRRVPRLYRVRDYDYRRPTLDLTAEATIESGSGGEIYEYGANYATPEEGRRIARVRADELRASRVVHEGKSDEPTLRAGSIVEIEGHPRGTLRLLVIDVEHRGEVTALGQGRGEERGYRNVFHAIPEDVPYRPRRTTPKPRVRGLLTGIIEGAGEGEEYAHLDEHGRYRVRLVFDESETTEGHASLPIRMAQPHAGAGYGMHFPLRPGVEVLIACLDGDPDRPVIAGCVPNALTPSPVNVNNRAKNVLRTGGSNEIAIDDTKGGQRIKMSTPHRDTLLQLGAPNGAEDGALLSTAGYATTVSKGGANLLSTASFGISAFNAIASGDVVTMAETNVLEFLAAAFEGVEAFAEGGGAIIAHLKKNADDAVKKDEEAIAEKRRQLAEAQATYDRKALEYRIAKQEPTPKPEPDKGSGKGDGEETKKAEEAPNEGGKEGGEGGDPITETPTEADVQAAKKARDDRASELEALETKKKQAEARLKRVEDVETYYEASTAAVGVGAKLFSLLTAIKMLRINAKVVGELAASWGEREAIAAASFTRTVDLPLLGPYNVAAAEGTSALLGDKDAFVAAPRSTLFGATSASVMGGTATVASEAMTTIAAGEAVTVRAGAPGTAQMAIEAAGTVEIEATTSISIETPGTATVAGETSVAVESEAVSITGNGGVIVQGGPIGMAANGSFEATSTGTMTLTSLAEATLRAQAEVAISTGNVGLQIAPGGLRLGFAYLAGAMPGVTVAPAGVLIVADAQNMLAVTRGAGPQMRGSSVDIEGVANVNVGGALVLIG